MPKWHPVSTLQHWLQCSVHHHFVLCREFCALPGMCLKKDVRELPICGIALLSKEPVTDAYLMVLVQGHVVPGREDMLAAAACLPAQLR